MRELVADFFSRHPECSFRVLGSRANRDALDLAPFGHPAEFLDAAAHPAWVERYHAANLARFTGPVSLPGWVLVDLYLMPAAIGMITCPARLCEVRPEGLHDDDEAVAAAYYAAPSIVAGTVIGVSLISLRKLQGGPALVKAMTLAMLRATRQRGVAQWSNPSLRVHTRLGPLVLEGPVPAAHGKASETFVYSVDLQDHEAVATAMKRPHQDDPEAPEGARWIPVADQAALAALLARAAAGERVEVLPPGLSTDGTKVLVRHG